MKPKRFTLTNLIHFISIIVFFSIAVTENLFIGILAGISTEIISWILIKTIPLIWKGIVWLIPVIYMTIMLFVCIIVWLFTVGGRAHNFNNIEEENDWPYY